MRLQNLPSWKDWTKDNKIQGNRREAGFWGAYYSHLPVKASPLLAWHGHTSFHNSNLRINLVLLLHKKSTSHQTHGSDCPANYLMNTFNTGPMCETNSFMKWIMGLSVTLKNQVTKYNLWISLMSAVSHRDYNDHSVFHCHCKLLCDRGP